MRYLKIGFVLFICFLIFGCLSGFLGTVLFKFWSPVLLMIPKLPNSFFDALVKCLAVLLFTTLLCYLVGLLFGTKFGTKIRGKTPILKGMGDLSHRPFVIVKDYPSEGFWMMGIITGKQKFNDNSQGRIRPRVYIPNPSNPTSGYLIFPEKEKLVLIKPSTSSMIQMIVSMGILGPGVIRLESGDINLDSYYL